LPDDVQEQISDIACDVPAARRAPIDQLHITLSFLGEAHEGAFLDVREALDDVDSPPFDITLRSVGFFPPRRDPRVLWVGVDPCDALLRLQREVQSVVQSCGVETEKRTFSPHVTVARIKEGSPVQAIVPFLQENALFCAGPVHVTEFQLYSSHLSPDGAVHTVEQRYELV
jgi:2'-5' RNA ligase